MPEPEIAAPVESVAEITYDDANVDGVVNEKENDEPGPLVVSVRVVPPALTLKSVDTARVGPLLSMGVIVHDKVELTRTVAGTMQDSVDAVVGLPKTIKF